MHWTQEAKDTVWLMALQGVNYLAPLLVWPYLMMVLGAQQFGVFSFGIATAQYLMLLVDFGFNLTATKQVTVARFNNLELNRVFTSTMAAKMILLTISFVLLFGISFIPRFAPYRYIMRISWLMVFGNAFSMFWLFQGLGKVRLVSIINTAIKLLILPLTFVLVRQPSDVSIATWIQVLSVVLVGLISSLMTVKKGMAKVVSVDKQDVKEAFQSSWSIFLSNAATSIYTALFVVILAYFVPTDEVGRYAAADKMMRCLCSIFWLPLSQAYFPFISRLSRDNSSAGRILVKRLSWLMAGAMMLVGMVLFFGTEPLVAILGKGYVGIGHVTAILAFVPIFVAVGGVQGQMGLIALGDEEDKVSFRNVYLIAGAISLISVCALSYLYGAIGAAIALLITEAIICLSMTLLNKKHHG